MSSSLAWAAPIANTATAPTQVVSRKLRIGILPATVPRVTTHEHRACRGSAPIQWEDFQQRVTAQRRRRVAFTPRLAYEHTSGFPLHLTYLKPEARKKPIPAINRLQPSFWAFVEPTGLDAAKNFHIERLLRE